MKKIMLKMLLIGAIALSLGADAFARSRSGGGFSRSSSRSYSRPTTRTTKYTPSKPKATTSKSYTKSTTKKTGGVKKTSGGFGAKKVDTKSASYKKTNAQVKKDFGTSDKKYSSMKEAKSDLGTKMASKKYTHKSSASAMASRPSHIPQSYQGHTTVYNMNSGGYGYYSGGLWMPYLVSHMIISDSMMHSYAPNAYNTHVVHHQGGLGIGVFAGVLALLVVVICIFGMWSEI